MVGLLLRDLKQLKTPRNITRLSRLVPLIQEPDAADQRIGAGDIAGLWKGSAEAWRRGRSSLPTDPRAVAAREEAEDPGGRHVT